MLYYVVAVSFLIKQRPLIPRCETLTAYYEFLGVHVTRGGSKKTEDLCNLVTDPLKLKFFLHVSSGHQKLANYLKSLGLNIDREGVITTNAGFNRRDNR